MLPFIVSQLGGVLTQLTRMGWVALEEYQTIGKDLDQFLQASLDHRILGLHLLSVIVQDINTPSPPRYSAMFRKAGKIDDENRTGIPFTNDFSLFCSTAKRLVLGILNFWIYSKWHSKLWRNYWVGLFVLTKVKSVIIIHPWEFTFFFFGFSWSRKSNAGKYFTCPGELFIVWFCGNKLGWSRWRHWYCAGNIIKKKSIYNNVRNLHSLSMIIGPYILETRLWTRSLCCYLFPSLSRIWTTPHIKGNYEGKNNSKNAVFYIRIKN